MGGISRRLRNKIRSMYSSTDTEIAAILVDTGTTLDTIADAVLVDTGTTIPASLTTIDNEIATIDGIADNLLLYAAPAVAAGTTDVDISESDYTGFITLLTVTAPAAGLSDLVIDLDFDKATTGVNEIATNADTLDVQLQVSPDGTNFVGVENITQITLTGTAGSIANGVNGHRFKVGSLYAAGVAKVLIKLSAERDDAEVPYRVTYRGLAAPTVTAVAAA